MTEWVDQLHRNNVPAHSTALVQAFFGKASHLPGLSASLLPRFGSLQLLVFPKAKIAVEREVICDGHTLRKICQQRLTADWLAPWESDCSRMRSKVSSDWPPSYIKATRPVLEIFKMDGYLPDYPHILLAQFLPAYNRLLEARQTPTKQTPGDEMIYFPVTSILLISSNEKEFPSLCKYEGINM